MTVTATEFKLNMGKYFDIIRNSDETITITKNGSIIAELRRPQISAVDTLSTLLTPREINKINSYGDNYRDIVMEEKYGITL